MDKKNVLYLVGGLAVGFVAGAVADAYSEPIEDAVEFVAGKFGILKRKLFKKEKSDKTLVDESFNEEDEDFDEKEENDFEGKRVMPSNDPLIFEKPDPRDLLKYKRAITGNGYFAPIVEANAIEEAAKKAEEEEKAEAEKEAALPHNAFSTYHDEIPFESLGDRADAAAANSTMDEEDMFEYIDESEFDVDNGFDKIQLMYFPNEDILVSEHHEEPVNPDTMVGAAAYNDLLKGVDEVYLRNNNIGADIKVVTNLDEGYYDWVKED